MYTLYSIGLYLLIGIVFGSVIMNMLESGKYEINERVYNEIMDRSTDSDKEVYHAIHPDLFKTKETFKIVCVDNFGREDKSDKLIAENVDKYHGELICNKLNSEDQNNFYKVVENDYKLFVFEGY